MNKICLECGTVSPKRVRVMKGSLGLELVLWLLFLLPGLIYSVWRHSSVYYGCPRCRGARLVPLDTPVGRDLLARFAARPVTHYHGVPSVDELQAASVGTVWDVGTLINRKSQ